MQRHLKECEQPDWALRHICRVLVRTARQHLRGLPHPASVHGARKEIKQLRAILRLTRSSIRWRTYRRTMRWLRQVASLLAATRDARVRCRVFGKIAGAEAARKYPALQKSLLKDHRREWQRIKAKDSFNRAKRALKKAGKQARKLKISAKAWATIAPGLQDSYRRGQRMQQRVHRSPTPKHFHEWRKQVKSFGHQLRLICPGWPSPTRQRLERLDKLAIVLGEEHDLMLLNYFASEHAPARELAALKPRIEARLKKQRAAALKLGARLYGETPSELCRQVGKDWQTWSASRK